MPYTSENGIIPYTQQELLEQFTNSYNKYISEFSTETVEEVTSEEMRKSNVWKVFYMATGDWMIQTQAKFQKAMALQMQYIIDNKIAIGFPPGVLPQGRLKAFEGLCDGIAYRDCYNDPVKTKPYELSICFDNLVDYDQNPELTAKVNDAFAISTPQAVKFIPEQYLDDPEIFIDFTYQDETGYSKTVSYQNLLPSDYTLVDLKVTYYLKQDGISPILKEIEDLLRERFNEYNKIGVWIYNDAYISSQDFEGFSDIVIYSKLKTDTDYQTTDRECSFNQKFILDQIELEQGNG